MNQNEYHTLLERGEVTVNGKRYTAEKSQLLIGRS